MLLLQGFYDSQKPNHISAVFISSLCAMHCKKIYRSKQKKNICQQYKWVKSKFSMFGIYRLDSENNENHTHVIFDYTTTTKCRTVSDNALFIRNLIYDLTLIPFIFSHLNKYAIWRCDFWQLLCSAKPFSIISRSSS